MVHRSYLHRLPIRIKGTEISETAEVFPCEDVTTLRAAPSMPAFSERTEFSASLVTMSSTMTFRELLCSGAPFERCCLSFARSLNSEAGGSYLYCV